ncbi:hypothetical protein F5B22DRAFT_584184 [Xylaria bambusicola]|uniref:uncharacterized protein n=1 Tax=Xylaria bambusicola TaxID=326684 RepID=UPI00200865FB|nr:uncharacterized protein F5B22DRAFT_584184 [Xylaria bambusicola]KAI0528211.1 hypothetical protein F5B22DRAFT_584184 [Xylaria bambusicola]
MLAVQPRRWLTRPKGLLVFAFTVTTLYWLMLHSSSHYRDVIRENPAAVANDALKQPVIEEIDDGENPNHVPSFEDKMKEAQDEQQEAIRQQFRLEYDQLGRQSGADAIYGKTLNNLDISKSRSRSFEAQLTPADTPSYFTTHKPYVYNPYPKHMQNSKGGLYVPCDGPGGKVISDIKVFKGIPKDFPEPLIGGYDILEMDGDLCFERETRLGMYGFQNANDTSDPSVDWDKVHWGELQEKCVQKNKARFDLQGQPNPYVNSVYSDKKTAPFIGADNELDLEDTPKGRDHNDDLRRGFGASNKRPTSGTSRPENAESRSAILLRTYTGKDYNENDKQVIRALITELSLRTGGLYQVFLLVHVKDNAYAIWDDEGTYQYVLQQNVPAEFRDIAVLWNDEAVQAMYPKLDPSKANVHVSQWLSVQKFIQEFPEFDYVWNWEMDARITGQHYDFLEKLAAFAKKQPRRGLWERNERYYVPSVHGDYDTNFRKEVEELTGEDTIWGPPDFPFVTPVGPKPPVAQPEKDDYQWGVGEEADLITVAPIINTNFSGWVGANDVWGFNDSSHATQQLPRRVTIVTHSRISKKLLDIMHVENLRGNVIASEMTCQTIALLHGLKPVYAPMPMFFDRPWKGKDIIRWFNSGEKGDSGGDNSAIGWGREARYGGITWYYRAGPPQRLYNNLMGYEDTKMGGEEWEEIHGRPCLPPILMHPIKDVAPTESGYESESRLPFG